MRPKSALRHLFEDYDTGFWNMRADRFSKLPRVCFAALIIGCGLLVLSCATAPLRQPVQPLADYLLARFGQTGFSGAVWVEAKGSVVLKQAYGYADRELAVPLTVGSIFRIGSLTKPITATAILLLNDQGRLRLTDSVCKFLTGCPESWQPVTIRHLLNHTSGIPDLFGDLDSVPVEQTAREVDDVLNEISSLDPATTPGSQFRYSNFNYVLLGYVIEKVSGQFWEQFLIDNVFSPLSMSSTRYDNVWSLVPGRAHGYTVVNGRAANIEYDDHAAYAAGGLRSTLEDLVRWHRAYVGDELIERQTRIEATTPEFGNYGLGWQILSLFGRPMYNHSGGIDGFTSHLAYYPEDELLIVVLSNLDREDAKSTACDLAALYFSTEPAPSGDREWLSAPRNERCRPSFEN